MLDIVPNMLYQCYSVLNIAKKKFYKGNIKQQQKIIRFDCEMYFYTSNQQDLFQKSLHL